MNVTAEKTLNAIKEQIESDNGAEFKRQEQIILPQMHDAYKADKKDGLRDHLGASVIGETCLRKIWLNYRGCNQSTIDARMIRLFNRGHLEEARFHAMLRAIGCITWFDDNGKQFGYKDGVFAGSIDGLAVDIPDCPNELVMLEFKTMNDSRFKQFVSTDMLNFKGYENQCKINMYCMSKYSQDTLNTLAKSCENRKVEPTLWNTLFIAVNKNTDEIHATLIHRDDEWVVRNLNDRIEKALSQTPPSTLHDSIKFVTCKMCSLNKYCFDNKPLPHNCRTCELFNVQENKCQLELEFNEDCYIPVEIKEK